MKPATDVHGSTYVKSRRVYAAALQPKPMKKKPSILSPATTKKSTATQTPAATMTEPPQTPSSPRTARTTMLKKRFAGTILKAERQLFGNGRKNIIVTTKPTIEGLRRAVGEARVVRKKPTIKELRRAAREALEKVEQSVDIEDNFKTMKEMQRLCLWPIPTVGGFLNRMHYLGLYLKA